MAIGSGVFPLSLSPLSVTQRKNARVKFFLEVFQCITHDGLSERGATRSLNRHKNTTAILNPDKLTIVSTRHGNLTALRISKAIRFSVAFPCARLFWRDCGPAPTAISNYICTPKVENAHVTCGVKLQVKFTSTF